MRKFLSDVLIDCGLTVNGTASFGTATATTVATSDNSTNIATTAWVKSLGYSTTDSYISGVSLIGNSLSFTGINSAFTGTIDLSSIVTVPVVETVYETVKNVSGNVIYKGTPLAVVEGQTEGFVSDVVPADASDPTKMPALFIANEDMQDEAEGEAVVFGAFSGVDTSLYPSGTVVYVAAGGGWTDTKPVWPNKIQNLGVITKSHQSNGGGIVTGVGRANDIPNLTAGKIWVGSANYPVESTTVHVDEANGRLGIGTTSPSYKLEVVGGSVNTQIARFVTADYPTHSVGLGVDAQSAYWGASIFQDDVKRFTVDSTGGILVGGNYQGSNAPANGAAIEGNVAIGTTTPEAKLHVVSGVSEAGILSRGSSGDTWFPYSNGNNYIRGTTHFDNAPAYFTGGNVGIGTTSPTSPGGFTKIVHINGGYASLVLTSTIPSKTWEIGVNSSSLLTFYDGVADRLVINSSGNVGIGTTSPSARLHIKTPGASTILFENQSGGTQTAKILYDQSGQNKLVISTQYQSATDLNLIQFAPADSIAMTIRGGTGSNNGNVGIGTTSPTQKLEVNGNIKLSSTVGATATPSYIWLGNDFSDGTTKDKLKIYLYNDGADERYGFSVGNIADVQYHSNVYHDFYTSNSLSLRIDGSGNVGIGTTPNQGVRLQVSGAVDVWNSLNTLLRLEHDGTRGLIQSYTGGGYSSTAISPYGGNVGIGTTSPEEKLHVIGNIKVGGEEGTIYYWNGSTINDQRIGRIRPISTPSQNPYAGGLAFDYYKYNGSTYTWFEGMRLSGSGNVGIGTTNPSYPLEVSGQGGIYVNGGTATSIIYPSLFVNNYIETTAFKASYSGNVNGGYSGGYTSSNSVGNTAVLARVSSTAGIINYAEYGINSLNGFVLGQLGDAAVKGIYGSDSLEFITASSTRAVIDSAGNVGIGITSPTKKLHVIDASGAANGSQNIMALFGNTTAGATSNAIYIGAYSGADWLIGKNIYGVADQTYFQIGNQSGTTPVLTINASNNAGIGTIPSTGDKLEVGGSLRVHTGNNWDGVTIYADGANGYIRGLGDETGLHIRSEYGNIFIADDRGKVAIGTTATPQKILDVNGSGIVASIGGAIGTGSFAGFHFGYSETIYGNDSYKKSALVFERTDNHGQGSNASGKIHFLLNNISNGSATNLTHSVFTIDTDAVATQGSARVGIGTSSPQEAVHAKGNIRIDGSSTAVVLQTGDKTASGSGAVFATYDTTATYGAVVDYVVYDSDRNNMRTGTFTAVWNTNETNYNDVSTVDIGDTSTVTLTSQINGADVELIVTGDTQYTIKFNVKLIK